MRPTKPCAAAAVCLTAWTAQSPCCGRQASSSKLNCSLTPHNAGDLEGIVSYAAERDLILEVNTYMFPPLRRDPAMVGRNDRFTPVKAVITDNPEDDAI